jgi:hypothetical protein
MAKTQTLQWLAQHEPIPEMAVEDFTRLVKEGFSLQVDIHPRGKKYFARISDSPPVRGSDVRSMLVPTHAKLGIRVSPLCILQVLAKFDKTEEDFRKAYNRILSQKAS